MNASQAKARSDILKALAHPTRILMLDALSRGDLCVTDLQEFAAASLPTVSHHLDKLKGVGIVTERREGKRVVHHLACPCMLEAVHCTLGVIRAQRGRRRKSG